VAIRMTKVVRDFPVGLGRGAEAAGSQGALAGC
jgi:hypothetical protein